MSHGISGRYFRKPPPRGVGGLFTDFVSTMTGVTVAKPPPFKDLIGTLTTKKNEFGRQFGYFTQPSTQGNKSVPRTPLWAAYYSIVEPIIQMLPAAKERSAQNTEYPQQAFTTAIDRYRSRVGFVTKARADANGVLMLTFAEADIFWNEVTRLAIAIHVVYGVPTASQIQAEVIASTITDTAK